MIKNMNSKMTTNPQLPTTEPQTKTKQKNLCKQLKQKQNHRNVDHMRGYQWEGRWGRMRKNVQGIRSINDWYKIYCTGGG